MQELLRTNDAVLISFAVSLLEGEGIVHAVFDTNMSIIEGSLGILPRRLMVDPRSNWTCPASIDRSGYRL